MRVGQQFGHENQDGWSVLLKVSSGWGATLRVALLLSILTGGAVALAIFLGPAGVASVAALLGGVILRRTVQEQKSRAAER